MAAKLGVSWEQASHARRHALSGQKGEAVVPKPRPLSARWRTPEALADITSDITNRELADKLKISRAAANLLRYSLAKTPNLVRCTQSYPSAAAVAPKIGGNRPMSEPSFTAMNS